MNRALGWIVKFGCLALFIFCVMMGVVFGSIAASEARPETATVDWVVAVIAWLLVVLSAVGFYLSLRLEVPASLRFIARRPFKFKTMKTVWKQMPASAAKRRSDTTLSEDY
jgi:hypothetical protein